MTAKHDQLVITAEIEEVIAAVEAINLEAPWSEIAPKLRIALPRRRELPDGVEDLPIRDFDCGISAGLGLDIGPAMLFVNEHQLNGWGVTVDQAFDHALDNVRASVAARKQFALIHERIADVPTVAFQSREGWASTLLLLPDELTRVLGQRDGLVLAPMRDLVMWLPLDAEPSFAVFLLEEFADADMNALDLPIFVMLDGELAPTVAVRVPEHGDEPMH